MVKRVEKPKVNDLASFSEETVDGANRTPKAVGSNAIGLKLGILVVVALVSFAIYNFVGPSSRSSAQRIAYLESIIKCPTCISVSTKDANTASAFAVRSFIAQMVHQGASDNQIISQLTTTYGPSILLVPPGSSGGLYLGGAAVVVGGGLPLGGFIYYRHRRRKAGGASGALEDEMVEDSVSIPVQGASDASVAKAHRVENTKRRFSGATPKQKLVAAIGTLLLFGGIGLAVYGLVASASAPANHLSSAEIASRVSAGEALAGTGSDTAAMQVFATVLNSNPNQPEALAWNGWLLHLAGHKDGSAGLISAGLQQMKQAVALNPNYIYARLFYGIALFQDRKEAAAAVGQFKAYFQLSPPAALNAQVRTIVNAAYAAAKLPAPL